MNFFGFWWWWGLFMIAISPGGTPWSKTWIGDKDVLLALCSPDLGVEGKEEILARSSLPLSFDTCVSVCTLVVELEADFFIGFSFTSSSELSSWPLFVLAAIYSMSSLVWSLEAAHLCWSKFVSVLVVIVSFKVSCAVTWLFMVFNRVRQ